MTNPWLQFLGRLHPLVLHAPIGLLIALVALEFIALARCRPLTADMRAPLAWLVAVSAIVSVASGLALSQEQTVSDTMQLHQWLAIGVAITTLTAALLQQRRRFLAYAIFMTASLGLLIPAGHFGASMTHGANFLTEPFTRGAAPGRDTPPLPVAPAGDTRFSSTILPILESRCVSCHGATRQKGGLALHTLDGVLRGSKQGSIIDAAHPAESELLVRLRLPLDDDDHMPPAEKPQLTPDQIATIEAWVNDGPTSAISTGTSAASRPADAVSAPVQPPPAPRDALDALGSALIHVEAVSQGSPLLVIDTAAVATSMTDESITRLLSPIREQVAELSLARTRITDESASFLASLPNLRRLNLTATAVTSETLKALANHPALEDLTLARTKVSDAAVMASIPHLKRLYVWSTAVTPEDLAALSAKRPDILIDSGAPPLDPVVEAETSIKFTDDLSPPGAAPVSPAPSTLAATNTACPVSGAPINPDRVILFKGKLIAFCCEKCAAQFWLDPDKFAANLK